MILPVSILSALAFLFALALAGSALGVWLADMPDFSRRAVSFSGGVLMGIAFFWVLPEIITISGWRTALGGIVAAFAALSLVGRYVYQICPACSHTHDHHGCVRKLHGFAPPLIAAAALHSFFDGWAVSLAQMQQSRDIRIAFLAGIGAHKIPEGLALGVLLLAATNSAWKALAGSAGIQLVMALGGSLAVVFAKQMNQNLTSGFLAAAAGVFLYLGYHAVENEYRARGWATALPALTGAAGAAVLRLLPGF